MATFFETIHEKYVSDHNTSVDYNKEAKGKGDYLSGKAQAYADVLDMLNSDFKVIKNTIPNKSSISFPEYEEAASSATDNTSSPKLPELSEEIYDELWGEYRKSTWTYPPYMPVIRRVLEIVAGKIGR